jgi:uncharacterized membrane protein YphA (DoxX/SURF4 family)
LTETLKDRLARCRQIKLSVIGRKFGKTKLHREKDLQVSRIAVVVWTILRVVAAVLVAGWAALHLRLAGSCYRPEWLKPAVAGTGVILLLGSLSMLLGVYPVVGIILLIVFLLGVSFQMHSYWKVDDAQMKQIDMINFTKNMALVGALLMFLLLPRPWPMSLGIG